MSEREVISVVKGPSKEEARQLWEDADWLEVSLSACREISSNVNAYPEDRQMAIGVWGAIIAAGYAPEVTPDGKNFIKVIRDVQLAIVRGRPLAYDKEQRQLCRERLMGLMWTVEVASQIFPVKNGSLAEELKKAFDGKKKGDLPPSDAN